MKIYKGKFLSTCYHPEMEEKDVLFYKEEYSSLVKLLNIDYLDNQEYLCILSYLQPTLRRIWEDN